MTTTLAQTLRSTTADGLGERCDAFDVAAYREALTRAWALDESGEAAELEEDALREVCWSVLEGRAGRDAEGRDWVQVANARRAAKAAAVERAIRDFRGPSNAGLRKTLREAAFGECPLAALEALRRTTALTNVGRAYFDAVVDAVRETMARGEIATPEQRAVAADEAEERSILTGEVLRERGLCPLVVVRSWDSGVHIGLLARYDRSNGDVELFDARRLHRWRGANTLHEVALRGVDNAYTRLSEPVRLIAVPGVCEVLPVADAARENLTTSRWARE